MKHSPIRTTLGTTLPFLCLLLPIWAITTKNKATLPAPTPEQSASTHYPAEIILRSAHPYEKVTLTLGRQKIDLTKNQTETFANIPLKENALRIQLKVTWAPKAPETALLLEIIPEKLPKKQYTIWGKHTALEEITFTWTKEEQQATQLP